MNDPFTMTDPDFAEHLSDLSRFVEEAVSMEASLGMLAERVAHILGCRHCSIMLIKHPEGAPHPMLRVEAHHGHLPPEAYATAVSLDAGISGHVAATGIPLLINDLHQSGFVHLARRETECADDLISVPIQLDGAVVGVINLDSPQGREHLTTGDLNAATALALTVGQAMRIHRLQGLLKTCFLQSILARTMPDTHAGRNPDAAPDPTGPQPAAIGGDPDRLVRLIAHTLYREMKQVGFARDHVLGLASELVARVSDEMTRNHRKASQPEGPSKPEPPATGHPHAKTRSA